MIKNVDFQNHQVQGERVVSTASLFLCHREEEQIKLKNFIRQKGKMSRHVEQL
jgi:hypothetical protein